MRTRMQEELDPRCLWVVTVEQEDGTRIERRCDRPARWEYIKKVSTANRLPSVERYTMCGKHASEKNRQVASDRGYTVRSITPYEDAS